MRVNLERRTYEVDLIGVAHKGKAGAKRATSGPAKAEQRKAAPKIPDVTPAPAQKKPEKKALPEKVVPEKTALPLTTNATKEAPPKPEAKKEAVAKPQKAEAKKAAKVEKKQTKEDILAAALGDAKKTAATEEKAPPQTGDALADALASVERDVSGQGKGTAGDGTAEDGPGEGDSTGSLADWYAGQVQKAIRENWRFPRFSNVVLATTVELRLSRGGEILSSRIINGSGRVDFDASILRAIEDTKILPPVPEDVGDTVVATFYNTENQ